MERGGVDHGPESISRAQVLRRASIQAWEHFAFVDIGTALRCGC